MFTGGNPFHIQTTMSKYNIIFLWVRQNDDDNT